MATCIHGQEAGSCLICRTLGTGPVTADRVATATSIPAGTPQVLNSAPPRRRHFGLVGWLFVIVVAALLGWWILGLVWAVLRIAEMVIVGALCTYVGYKIGVVSGKHQARHPG